MWFRIANFFLHLELMQATTSKTFVSSSKVATLLDLIGQAIFDTSIKHSMKKPPKTTAAFRRCIALTLSSLFLLFLSFSQPHRVHHLFEGHDHSHNEVDSESDNHRHDQTKPARADCVVQSVAQNCHLGQADLVKLPFVKSHLESFQPQAGLRVDSFTSFPFLQRAPPKDTALS
jgi:hypothetical protein